MTTDTQTKVRDLHVDLITETVAELCETATHFLPDDVVAGLERARETEQSALGKQVLVEILENADLAKREMLPLCQDTGTTVVFVELGQDVHIVGGALTDAIKGLDRYHLFHATRADMLRRLERNADAAGAYRIALGHVTNQSERRFLEQRLEQCLGA